MPSAVGQGLQLRGVDVTTSKDAELLGASDEKQLAFALRESRVLLTRDKDFLRLSARGTEHSGIVFWTQRHRPLGPFIRAVDVLSFARTVEDLRGQVVFL